MILRLIQDGKSTKAHSQLPHIVARLMIAPNEDGQDRRGLLARVVSGLGGVNASGIRSEVAASASSRVFEASRFPNQQSNAPVKASESAVLFRHGERLEVGVVPDGLEKSSVR